MKTDKQTSPKKTANRRISNPVRLVAISGILSISGVLLGSFFTSMFQSAEWERQTDHFFQRLGTSGDIKAGDDFVRRSFELHAVVHDEQGRRLDWAAHIQAVVLLRQLNLTAECRGNRLQGLDGDRSVKFGGTLPELYDEGDNVFVTLDVDGAKARGYDRGSGGFYEAIVSEALVQLYDHGEGVWYSYDIRVP